jgi:PAS domain-containing protein
MTRTSEDAAIDSVLIPASEFAAIFDKTPGSFLILDPSFTIMAANDAYCSATLTQREALLGRRVFEAFPDNPDDPTADGVENLRASLLKVLKTRQPHSMDIQKYDVRRQGTDAFEERYWSPQNVPVLGDDGYVKWIIHCVEDVTELMSLRAEFAAKRDSASAQRLLLQLRDIERELAAERIENAELRVTLGRQAKG